ncbi:HRDC domain-containing protein [Flavobacterium enshiense]|uniref:HRDC domain-containing protein n=1 Tax=Flavobacterium enshiense TaxID=1341165 RepID=UPI00345CF7A7
MQLQVFNIRVAPNHYETDQKKLNDFLAEVKFVQSSAQIVNAEQETAFWSVLIQYETDSVPCINDKSKAKEIEESDLTPGGQYILECLKEWRTDKASTLNVPKYLVCHNSELINIAYHLPQSIEALRKIKGFGEKKAMKYGEDIIAVLNAV